LNLSTFKQVDIIRNHPGKINCFRNYLRSTTTKPNKNHHFAYLFYLSAANSREELTARDPNASRDEKKLLQDVMEANNLTYPNIVSKVESPDEILDVPNKPSAVTTQVFDSSFLQDGMDEKGLGTTTLNKCSSQVLISHCAHDSLGAFLSNQLNNKRAILF
jgi:hypothetical protein